VLGIVISITITRGTHWQPAAKNAPPFLFGKSRVEGMQYWRGAVWVLPSIRGKPRDKWTNQDMPRVTICHFSAHKGIDVCTNQSAVDMGHLVPLGPIGKLHVSMFDTWCAEKPS
jgi:hypothetical protein